ncbi:MAG TPA: hypothetical protein VNJ48_06680 [Nocardioides sp.]|nr:hypothetical protein [Nocardioides sp.]
MSQYAGASLEVRNHALRLALGEHGYDPLDAIRARYWLRRGKPANYRWDDAAFPQDRFSEVLDTYTPSGSAHRATEGNQP